MFFYLSELICQVLRFDPKYTMSRILIRVINTFYLSELICQVLRFDPRYTDTPDTPDILTPDIHDPRYTTP